MNAYLWSIYHRPRARLVRIPFGRWWTVLKPGEFE